MVGRQAALRGHCKWYRMCQYEAYSGLCPASQSPVACIRYAQEEELMKKARGAERGTIWSAVEEDFNVCCILSFKDDDAAKWKGQNALSLETTPPPRVQSRVTVNEQRPQQQV